MARGRNARFSRYLRPGSQGRSLGTSAVWAATALLAGIFFAGSACSPRSEVTSALDTLVGSSHTPALPFRAELRRDPDGATVIVTATGELGGRFRVETAGRVIAEWPQTGGAVKLATSDGGSATEVVVIWQDVRGVMGARALLRSDKDEEVAPTWTRLSRPTGRIAEAVPISRPTGEPR